MKTFTKFHLFPRRKTFSGKVSPSKVFQSGPNNKRLISTCYIQVFLRNFFLQKVEKGKYHGDKFSFLSQETLKLLDR